LSNGAEVDIDFQKNFLELGGLRLLTAGFQTVVANVRQLQDAFFEEYATYYSVPLHSMRLMWVYLAKPPAVSLYKRSPEKYGFKEEQIASIVQTLFSLQSSSGEIFLKVVLNVVWNFLVAVEAQEGEIMLLKCLAAGAEGDPFTEMGANLLIHFTRNILMCREEALSFHVYEKFQHWRAVYPAVAEFTDAYCSVPGYVSRVILDGHQFAPAAAVKPNFDVTKARVVTDGEDRHCAYPGCRVTGVESELAATTLKCGRCKRVYYCSKAHQTEHWPAHKAVCKKG
jgi:hypothetical protein